MRYVVLIVLLVALFAIPAAVGAITQGTGTVGVSGSVSATCSISVNPTSVSFGAMQPSPTPYDSTTADVHIGCNVVPWTVVASDDTSGGKPAGYLWNTSYAVNLTNPFQFYGQYPSPGWIYLANNNPTTYAYVTSPGSVDYNAQFQQLVVASDLPYTYQTTVTFTLST